MGLDSTTRFSNRVEDYVRYRPGYPTAIVDSLEEEYGLVAGSSIADIGSGTGISSSLFLDRNYSVVGIEPNKEMREKSKQLLRNIPHFMALDGTAEHTKLPADSIQAIIVGQAFHWFDRDQTRKEFNRILKPEGIVVLMWNERLTSSRFEKEYDQLIVKHARDYVNVDHRNVDFARISEFFGPNPVKLKIFNNQQILDFGGLEGRLLSSSYMPTKDDAGYKGMSADVKNLFERYQENGLVSIKYSTKIFVGKWK